MRTFLTAGAAFVLLAATAHAATPQISAKPSLSPAFDPAVHDYVSRCGKGHALRLRVRARGGRAAIDGGRFRRGAFGKRIEIRAGQAAVVASRSGGRTTRYHVRCLPADYPKYTASRSGRTQASHYLVSPDGPGASNYPTIFDRNGVPVWWHPADTAAFDFKFLPNGNVAWSRYYSGDQIGWRKTAAYEEHTLTGRRVRLLKALGNPTDIHDLQVLANGNYLALIYKQRNHVDLSSVGGPSDAPVFDGEIQEITPRGRRVFRWNTKDHIALEESRGLGPMPVIELQDGRKVYDPVHVNSVEPNGKELIVSMRQSSAVYGINRKSGAVRWKLGGTERPESMTFVDDDRAAFGGQHDARLQPDGTLTIYDNSVGRNAPPRGVRYRIDRSAKTATLLDQITDPDVTTSFFAGGTRRLPGGNFAISWGGTPVLGEYRPSGEQVFALEFPEDFFSYRIIPIARGQLRTATLRRAMNRQFPRKR